MRIQYAHVLAACVLLVSCAAARRSTPAITEIGLERGCFGCQAGARLVLRSDGRATFTVTGSARHGTVDIVSEGVVRRKEFDSLVRLMTSSRFFELRDDYSDPQTQDGKWAIIRAVRGGEEKKVFNRNDAAPAAFVQIEEAIDAVRRTIAFAPASAPH